LTFAPNIVQLSLKVPKAVIENEVRFVSSQTVDIRTLSKFLEHGWLTDSAVKNWRPFPAKWRVGHVEESQIMLSEYQRYGNKKVIHWN
jgi:hypothetical protein